MLAPDEDHGRDDRDPREVEHPRGDLEVVPPDHAEVSADRDRRQDGNRGERTVESRPASDSDDGTDDGEAEDQGADQGMRSETEVLGEDAGIPAEAIVDVAGVVAVVGEQHRGEQQLEPGRRCRERGVRDGDVAPRDAAEPLVTETRDAISTDCTTPIAPIKHDRLAAEVVGDGHEHAEHHQITYRRGQQRPAVRTRSSHQITTATAAACGNSDSN